MNRLPKLLVMSVLICLSFMASVSGKDSIDYDNWGTMYYKKPNPEHFVDVVRNYENRGVLRNEDFKIPCAFLFGSIMAQNPQNIQSWVTELDDVRQKNKSFVNFMLWYSSTPVANELLKKYTDPEEYAVWFSTPPQTVYTLDTGAKNVLDMNWWCFFVTGDERPIINIMSAFKYSSYETYTKNFKFTSKTEEDKRRAFLGSISLAAKWSLVSNGKQHERVKQIIEAQAALSSGERQDILKSILNDIANNPYSK